IPVTAFLLGAVVWTVARAVGGRVRYAQGATIATFSFFPHVMESVVGGVQALLMDESQLTSRYSVSVGLGRIFDPATTNPILMALLGRIELFTLWSTVLVAV